MSGLPKTADVVILGGGVMGASTAYHLASHGHKNILLLERESFLVQEQPDVAKVAFVISSILKSIFDFLKKASP